MSAITEQIINSCKRVKYTEKLFFNKYIYKVILEPTLHSTVNVGQEFNYGYTSRWRMMQRAKNRQCSLMLSNDISRAFQDEDYRSRIEGKTFTVYTNSESNIETLLEKFNQNIIEIHCPYNDKHKDIIANDRKIRVRASLFDGNFKFKVTFRPTWEMREQRLPEIKEWINTLDAEGTRWAPNYILARFLENKKSHRELGWTIAVYLNDEADLFICRLKLHNIISQVEEAVLIKDL